MVRNIEEQVKIIQDKYFDNTSTEDKYMLRYMKEGYIEAVDMIIYEKDLQIKIQLWDSENNQLEWLEDETDYEPFETFLMRRLQTCFSTIRTAKMILE